MSRIGKQPIIIPQGITITIGAKNLITVKGPKGELSMTLHPIVSITMNEKEVVITRDGEQKEKRAIQGLMRTLIANMVQGVKEGFQKRLEINGVGYRAQVKGNILLLNLGYSHPIEHLIPEGIQIQMDPEKKNIIIVSGIDKQKVGQVSAVIRGYRKPEPYKGKGIKYEDEYIQRKAGKTASK
jgi:large subunit ribosomal protein L6